MADDNKDKDKDKDKGSTSAVMVNLRETMDALFKITEGEVSERIAIFTHPAPDPDAMACALGMKWLLASKYGIEADFIKMGESTRRQNTTMINVLGINMLDWEMVASGFDETYGRAIVVDALPDRLPPEAVKKLKVVVDHHDIQLTSAQKKKYDLVIIERVGSCCSLLYKLMRECQWLPGNPNNGSPAIAAVDDHIVATAMTAGIMIDTRGFMNIATHQLDLEAYTYFFGVADTKLGRKIDKYKEPRYLFELRGELIKPENYVIENTTYIGSAGYLPAGRTDALPQLADEFVRMEGVTTAIVFAIVGTDLIVKMRSEDDSLVVNNFLQKLFGENAGAKAGEGGGEIPLGLLAIESPSQDLRIKIYDTIKSVIMHLLSREVKNE